MNVENIIWYNNPIVLFLNIDQIYPYEHLTVIEKSNTIARLAFYIGIIIIFFRDYVIFDSSQRCWRQRQKRKEEEIIK
jgi:hypothetical protein